jgi:head-tail adaptor
MQPPGTQGDYGEEKGQEQVYLRNWPCSIEPLPGRESETANQTHGIRLYRVMLDGDPAKPITSAHWLRIGNRRLEIGDAQDIRQNGEVYELICGERA